MRATNKRDSIYFQLLMLLIISAVLSVILFVFLETTGTKLMDRFYDSEYGNRKNKAYVKELQKYVKEEYLYLWVVMLKLEENGLMIILILL